MARMADRTPGVGSCLASLASLARQLARLHNLVSPFERLRTPFKH